MNQFESLKISNEILKVIEELGFETPTSIQEKAIPLVFQGHDLIGQAQTGTGKTAAFGIPMIEKVSFVDKAVQVLVLTPTRELAIQVADELQKFSKYKKGVKTLAIYGGQPIERQIKALRQGVQIVVGTPGRILDHIRRKTLKLNNISGLVMDEADQMLDMGFQEEIEAILNEIPNGKQTLMFSATIPKEIEIIAQKYMNHPKKVKVVHKELTVPQITQFYFEVKTHEKLESLTRILDMESVALGMIFCNTKKGVDELVEKLQSRGYSVEGIHGDLKQSQRDRVMKKFRDGTIDMLIATDVAARGIDVDDVALVINYDLPENFEYYVHRIGRTGRAGRVGLAYTLVTPRQIRTMKMLERYIKTKLVRRKVPSFNDIVEKKKQEIAENIASIIETGGISEHMNFIEKLAETHNSIEIGAALLKMIMKKEEGELKESHEEEEDNNNAVEKGMVRLYFNIGKRHGINAGNLLGAIANEAGIDGGSVGAINMYDKFSFVEVPRHMERDIIKALKKKRIKGRKISVEVAKVRGC
ncbi:DEAD/DEAH box helicase [Alkaliphilus pronyensis]|uniref:ATP-dependent RNA helicase CshA n=1 Tax=Alkaliphilus pronyensis TaxID=1482732 RepID=A0A6I0F9W5_9FIRM|nr:DEAD/DEAH box helicase [Alkaliphilus pronyensis]KAB3535336.1 DEAD/DEAH box helicase [Alkaliphilus pronyensis]